MRTTPSAEQLAAIVSKAVTEALAVALAEGQPAKTTVPQPKAETSEFVTWLRDTAEARKARKESNADLAAWMRAQGLWAGGKAWALAKAGERDVKKLARANKADDKARAAK